MSDGKSGFQLRSLLKKSGELELSLINIPTPEPGDDEVVVRVGAAPINPSDLGLLFGATDPPPLRLRRDGATVVTAAIPEAAMTAMAGAARPVAAGRQRGRGHRRRGRVSAEATGAARAMHGRGVRRCDVLAVSVPRGRRPCLALPDGITPSRARPASSIR